MTRICCPLHELTVHVVGTGAVGLAYGYLLTERGHRVFHSSLRGRVTPAFPLSLQTGTGTTHGCYTPRYWHDTPQALIPHVQIFAVHGAQLAPALQLCGGALAPQACHLVFCSNPDAVDAAWQRVAADSYTLVYPLLSAEHCGDQGLRIITNGEVEITPPQGKPIGERIALKALLKRMGLTVSGDVPLSRFRARYLQTAAIYIALLAVSVGAIDHAQVDGALLSVIHDELAAMAERHDGTRVADVPGQARHFASLAALIAAGERDGTMLGATLEYLVRDGRRKLTAHLAAITPAWDDHLAARPATASQRLISTVLALCRP